jgi:AhpD family alkylhydroperoxidase
MGQQLTSRDQGRARATESGESSVGSERRDMQARLNYAQAAPGAYKAMLGLEEYLHTCRLEESLIHLIKLRASQINGCAYCLDMHWKDLRAIGESEQRLYSLDAWEECPYYSDRERAALAWTDAVTLVADGHVADSVYEKVRLHFSETPARRVASRTFSTLAVICGPFLICFTIPTCMS